LYIHQLILFVTSLFVHQTQFWMSLMLWCNVMEMLTQISADICSIESIGMLF